MGEGSRRNALIAAFVAVVTVALVADSPAMLRVGINGQPFDALLVPAFLALLVVHLPPSQRLLVLLVVPVTAVGELLLSPVLGLYVYKLEAVPLYVPFGHAVLVASTLLLASCGFVARHERAIRRVLLLGYALLGAAAIVVGDTLSLVLAVPFACVMWRSRARIFYLLMGAMVLFVECTGVLLGCWRWIPQPLGVLHTMNPPLLVYTIYVLGDAGLVRLSRVTEAGLAALARRGSGSRLAWFRRLRDGADAVAS